MGLLTFDAASKAVDAGGAPVRNARRFIFQEGTDFLAPLYRDPQLTEKLSNPAISNAQGLFETCYLMDGTYRIDITNSRRKTLASYPSVRISEREESGAIRVYGSVAALKADERLSYDTLQGRIRIYAGQFLAVMDGGHRYLVEDGASTTHHLVTSGGIKVRVMPRERGLNVRAFGATGDGVTDDAPAIQAAINAASNAPDAVFFPAGTYRCLADLYFCYHETANPGFIYPNVWYNELLGGRMVISGNGAMDRRDFQTGVHPGSVISFGPGKKAIFSRQEGGFRGGRKVVENLSFIGANGTIISDLFGSGFTTFRNIFVGTSAPAANTAVMHVSDTYVSRYENIDIVGDKDLDNNRIGWGFWAEPSDTAGGANSYINVTAGYFDKGLVFGRPYNPAFVGLPMNAHAHVADNLQGQACNVGIHIMQGTWNMTLTGCWAEHCDVAAIRADNSCQNIEFVSCNASKVAGTTAEPGVFVIGDNTGQSGPDGAFGIVVRNSFFTCTEGHTGVYVHDAARDVRIENSLFWNAGGGAVGVDGGRGGEVTLAGNNYHPQGATSRIGSGRRFATLSGSGAGTVFSSVSYLARSLDFAGSAIAANLDCTGWTQLPSELSFNTLSGTRTLTLPQLSAAGGPDARIRVLKPFAANTVVIDAGTGGSIKGVQTLVLSAAFSSVSLVHAGEGTNRWDIVAQA